MATAALRESPLKVPVQSPGNALMRTIALIILLVLIAGRADSRESPGDYSTSTVVAACDTNGALLCQNLLKDCLKSCNTSDNSKSCRQICLGQFRGCKASAGCGGS